MRNIIVLKDTFRQLPSENELKYHTCAGKDASADLDSVINQRAREHGTIVDTSFYSSGDVLFCLTEGGFLVCYGGDSFNHIVSVTDLSRVVQMDDDEENGGEHSPESELLDQSWFRLDILVEINSVVALSHDGNIVSVSLRGLDEVMESGWHVHYSFPQGENQLRPLN